MQLFNGDSHIIHCFRLSKGHHCHIVTFTQQYGEAKSERAKIHFVSLSVNHRFNLFFWFHYKMRKTPVKAKEIDCHFFLLLINFTFGKISLLFSCYSLGELFPLANLGHFNLTFIKSFSPFLLLQPLLLFPLLLLHFNLSFIKFFHHFSFSCCCCVVKTDISAKNWG